MANFSLYYPFLLKYEGGYASAAYAAKMGDKGGETYLGIARNYNKAWEGWAMIDAYIKTNGTPAWNQRIPRQEIYKAAEKHSKVAYWDKMKLDLVDNQSLAEMIGDYGFNSGIGLSVRAIQRIVYDSVEKVTGIMTLDDIAEINKCNALVLFTSLQAARINMITKSTKINIKFKNGLIARANAIKFKK